MKTIKIKSQEELDNIGILTERTYLDIHCKGLVITSDVKNGVFRLYGTSSAILYNNSSAKLYGTSSAILYNNSSAYLYNNSSAILYNNSSAELYGTSSAYLYNNSSAILYDNSSAILYNNSSAILYDNSSAILCGNSSAILYNNSSARLFQKSLARIFSIISKVVAYEQSHVFQHCSSVPQVQVFDSAKHLDISNDVEISFDTWLERGYVVADGIYQKLVSQEIDGDFTCYKTDKGYVYRKDNFFSHGDTKEEAKLDLIFKTSNRDLSQFKELDINELYDTQYLVFAYRCITGACKQGIKDFLKGAQLPDKMTIKQSILATAGKYGHENFKNFFKGN